MIMTIMKNNVYGLLGIGAYNALWNADFDKHPKTDGTNVLKGSAVALKYCIKKQWYNANQKVLGLKTMKKNGECNTLTERYYNIFNEEDIKLTKKATEKEKKEAIIKLFNNLITCKDILNFGTAYTGANSLSIQGVVQIGEGLNLYEDAVTYHEPILSPFANSKPKDGVAPKMSTVGERWMVNEAHYIYDFSIFPKEYDKYISDTFNGYSKEDYEDFKKQSLIAVSNYNSHSKAGCKNEFAMFIETKEKTNYQLDLNCLQQYIKTEKNQSNNNIIYDLTVVIKLLNDLIDKIDQIEIFYNPRTVEIKGLKKNNFISIYDLITREKL